MSTGRGVAVRLGLAHSPEREAELAEMGHGRRFLSLLDLTLAWQLVVGSLVAVALTGGLDAVLPAAVVGAVFLAACYALRAWTRSRRTR